MSTEDPNESSTEEIICIIEFISKDKKYTARIQSDIGGIREYFSNNLEDLLEQTTRDLQEEFESV
jgi:hypothetical protein